MKNFVIIALAMVLLAGCQQASKKVLLVFSYHQEYEWVEEETRGIDDIFADRNLIVEKFYMDTKRYPDIASIEKVSAEAISKIKEMAPDVVIVFDDNACKYVAQEFVGSDVPFVFCGMNADPEDYGFPAKNITGIEERGFWKESLDLLRELDPDISKTAILLDDSPTAHQAAKRIKKIASEDDILEVYMTNNFHDWQSKVIELQDKVDALGLFVYFTLHDTLSDQVIHADDVLNWTLENSKLPEFAILDFTVQNGALCGVIENGYSQGQMAAEIAIRILNGESAESIPIMSPAKGVPVINRHRATELGITIPDGLKERAKIL